MSFTRIKLVTAVAVAASLLFSAPVRAGENPVKVELKKAGDGKWQLVRDGKPYFIKGGGGGGSKTLLAEVGGNSFRTWGVGNDTRKELDQAHKLGLTVTLGYWVGHKSAGFNYADSAAVARQLEDFKRAVRTYKDHPAVLMWAVGNEMENGHDTPELWGHIQDMAKAARDIDPNHPTMTVIAEVGGNKVANIHKHCPDIDVVGINSYAGGPSVGERYIKAGGSKPYVITEFGPPGQWEIPKNKFGAVNELTSTEKARWYRMTYEGSVLGQPALCLGSYAFTWGYKIEATATWYGMFLPDGSRVTPIDTMQELWSGKAPAHPCPAIKTIAVTSADDVKAGDTVTAAIDVADPRSGTLKIEWVLYREQANYDVQGTGADATPSYPDAIEKNGEKAVTLKMPKFGGVYRLYCYARNEHGGAAVGSVPIKVSGADAPFRAAKAKLPLVIYGENRTAAPYIPSGYMGNHKSIAIDEKCTEKPYAGKTCIKAEYREGGNWGGVVWQSPPNDWGDKAGGLDLSAARTLTFWARGDKGGEKVKFGLGMIGKDKKYFDTDKASTPTVELTSEWKQYSIDLKGKDLSVIKSGFYWTLGGQGSPVTFYLAEIRYE